MSMRLAWFLDKNSKGATGRMSVIQLYWLCSVLVVRRITGRDMEHWFLATSPLAGERVSPGIHLMA